MNHIKRERFQAKIPAATLPFDIFAVYFNHCFVEFVLFSFSLRIFVFLFLYLCVFFSFLSPYVVYCRFVESPNKMNSANVNICTTWCRPFCLHYMRLYIFFSSSFEKKCALILFLFAFLTIYLFMNLSWLSYDMCASVCSCVYCIVYFELLTPHVRMEERTRLWWHFLLTHFNSITLN